MSSFSHKEKSSRRPWVRAFFEICSSYAAPVLSLICIGTVIIALEWLYAFRGYSFEADRPSPRTYRAVSPIKYTDMAVTNVLKDRAGESIVGVLTRDAGAPDRMRRRLAEFRDIEDFYPAAEGTENPPTPLESAFHGLPPERRETLLTFAEQIAGVYFEKVNSGDMNGVGHEQQELWSQIGKLGLPAGEENLLYQLLEELIDLGYNVDPQFTALTRETAKASILPIERMLEVGDVIVERGDVITRGVARLLRSQGYPENAFPLNQLLTSCLLMLGLPLWLNIAAQKPDNRRRKFEEVTWRCIVFLFGVGWTCEATAANLGVIGAGILPFTALTYLSMPRRMAFYTCLGGTVSGIFLITGLSMHDTLLLPIFASMIVMSGYYVFHNIDSRKQLSWKVFLLAAVMAFAQTLIRSIQMGTINWSAGGIWRSVGLYLAFDLAATFLLITLLPMVEGYIGTLSSMTAKELSHPSSPLMRKLQAEAPGTYHHCLMIGTMAEAVANELGMDENLMRAGAYYHDIGKLARPNYFVENQKGGQNVHDTISPTLSAVTIISHVREGIELANEFGLPQKVKQFIAEHHGTTSLSYFYKKAKNLGENVEMAQFQYSGPRPQSRETALLMLLDSTEAAMRSESRNINAAEDIQEVVDRVFAIKLAEKQLDDVDFTYREMSRIKNTILKVFQSMYHTRVVKEIQGQANSPAGR